VKTLLHGRAVPTFVETNTRIYTGYLVAYFFNYLCFTSIHRCPSRAEGIVPQERG